LKGFIYLNTEHRIFNKISNIHSCFWLYWWTLLRMEFRNETLRFVLACQIEVQGVEILSCLQNLTLNTFNAVNAIIQLMLSFSLQRLGQLGKTRHNNCVYCGQIHWKLVFCYQFLTIFWKKPYFQIVFSESLYFPILCWKVVIGYCYQSVNLIRFELDQSDYNKRLPLI
jgi:hypothetical protein